MAEIDYQMLASLIREKMRRENLSLFDVERACVVSRSTLSRACRGVGKVYSDTFAKLCGWLNVKADRLTGQAPRLLTSERGENETTLEVIHALILRDKTLAPAAQTALFRIMQVGYMLATK
jgi:transcriptional regulator with XRE-family HTH domain